MSYLRYRTKFSGDSGNEVLGQASQMYYPICSYNPGTISNFAKGMSKSEWCTDWVNPGPPYRVGYNFFLVRKTQEYGFSSHVNPRAYYYQYSGKFAINKTNDVTVDLAAQNYTPTAETFGAQAIARMRPVQPRMGLGQALGELRDFPKLFKLSLRKFKDLGSGYLNYKFGWKPFLKDLMDVIDFQKKLEKQVAFVRKNNNKWLRRSCTLHDSTETTTTQTGVVVPSLISYLYYPVGQTPKVTRYLILKDRVWAVGRMKYYIPELSVDRAEDIWTSPLLRRLSGLEITPSLLWELTPWTWLTDWFCNVGDLYSNISYSGYDNLVTKYAYVMRHRVTSVVYHATVATRMKPPICSGGKIIGFEAESRGPTPTCFAKFTAECKERAGAAWWGIGGNAGPALSDSQLSILLALGLQQV